MANLDEKSSEVKTKKAKAVDGVVFILLLVGAIVMVFPLIYMFLSSFMTKNQILSANFSIIPNPWKFGKYAEVLQKPEFLRGLRNTLIVALPVLIVGGFTSSLAAFSFSKLKFKGKSGIFLGLLATMMIPFAVVMIPQYVMFTKMGWTNSLLPLIIPGLFGNVSIIFFLRQNLTSVPDSIVEAAKIDGCNIFKEIRYITLPLLKPTFIMLVLFALGGIMRGQFDLFYNLIQRNGQLFRVTDVLDTYIYRAMTVNFNLGTSTAAGVYQSVFGFLLVVTVNHIIRKKSPENALF